MDFFLAVYDTPIRLPFPHDILIILYTLIIAYAILRHHLMDIEVVIKKTAVYSLLTALITGVFVSLILLGNYAFRDIVGYQSIWASVLGAFLIALIFQPLREGVQMLVDRVFFRARYDYQRVLNKYSHTLSQPMTDLNRFSRIAPYLIVKSMQLSGASVMVLDRESQNYLVRAGERDGRELEGSSLSASSDLVRELKSGRNELSLEEVEVMAKNGDEESARFKRIAADMKKLKAVLIIPCVTESAYFGKPTLISVLNLGRKLSDESFSSADIDFLSTLANQAALTVEYAFIFEELRRNQERLLRSEKLAAVGTTTAGVAHELKNPLTYLSAVSQVLPMKWDDPEFKKTVAKMLPAEVQRMQLIISGLLDYSRSKELVLKPLDVKTVVDKTLALLAYEIRKFKVEVKTEFNHTKSASADPNRIMQVFMNLMANAVQAMGENGGELTITTRDREREVETSIRDTGPGISQEKIKQVFDPFFTTKESGTGLGLSISKEIVDEHKGSIHVDSVPGQGTTFTVSLPEAAD